MRRKRMPGVVYQRCLYDMLPEAHMAIRLRSIKSGLSNGEIIMQMVTNFLAEDLKEAEQELAKRKQKE